MAIIGDLEDFDEDDTPLSDQGERKFYVIATLESDRDQRNLLEYLMDEGIICHSLTL